jgi:hypothetical protein
MSFTINPYLVLRVDRENFLELNRAAASFTMYDKY